MDQRLKVNLSDRMKWSSLGRSAGLKNVKAGDDLKPCKNDVPQ